MNYLGTWLKPNTTVRFEATGTDVIFGTLMVEGYLETRPGDVVEYKSYPASWFHKKEWWVRPKDKEDE